MYLDDCAILVICDVFFMVVQKYLLGRYLNTLALVNLKRSDFINNHKDKISYFNVAGSVLFMDPDSPVATITGPKRGEKKKTHPGIVTIW